MAADGPALRRSCLWLLAVVPAVFSLTAAPARGQILLTPPPAETSPPAPSGPEPPDGPPKGARDWPFNGHSKADILIEPIDVYGPDGRGAFDLRSGGLGPEMWRGLSRRQAMDLIEALPVGVASPAMNDLARRILLTRAEPPPGPPAGPGSFFVARARKALQMGFTTTGLLDAIGDMPVDEVTPEMHAIAFRAYAVAGNSRVACALPTPGDTSGPAAVRRRIFCAIEQSAPGFVFSPTGPDQTALEPETLFAHAVARRAYRSADPVPDTVRPDYLGLALMKNGKLTVPTRLGLSQPWQTALVAEAAAEPGFRLQQAERAVTFAALRPEALAALYSAAPPGPPDPATAIGRAALYRSVTDGWHARAADRPRPAAVAGLAAALAGVRNHAPEAYPAFVQTLTDLPARTPPQSAFAPSAAEIAFALAVGGRMDAARSWARLAAPGEAGLVGGRLSPFRLLIDGGLTASGLPEDAFGAPITVSDPARVTRTAGLDRLDAAAGDGRRGETALRGLGLLGAAGGPANAPVETLRAVLTAFETVGLNTAARNIAIEALVIRADR